VKAIKLAHATMNWTCNGSFLSKGKAWGALFGPLQNG